MTKRRGDRELTALSVESVAPQASNAISRPIMLMSHGESPLRGQLLHFLQKIFQETPDLPAVMVILIVSI